MYKVQYVLPEKLPEVWDFVKKGLKAIRSRTGASNYAWTSQHIFASLFNRQSSLYIVLEDEVAIGFFIVTIQNDPFLHVPVSLFIWLVYSEEKSPYQGFDVG